MNLKEGFTQPFQELPADQKAEALKTANQFRPIFESILGSRRKALLNLSEDSPSELSSRDDLRRTIFNNADYLIQYYTHSGSGESKITQQELYAFYTDGVIKKFMEFRAQNCRNFDGTISLRMEPVLAPHIYEEASVDQLKTLWQNLVENAPKTFGSLTISPLENQPI